MTQSRRLAMWALSSVAVEAACSAFSSTPLPSSPPDDGGASSDAREDTGLQDSGAADAPWRCLEGAHAFCDDFERPGTPVIYVPWLRVTNHDAGEISVVAGEGIAGSRALRVHMENVTDGDREIRLLGDVAQAGAKPRGAHLEYDQRVQDHAITALMYTGELYFGTVNAINVYAAARLEPNGALWGDFKGIDSASDASAQASFAYGTKWNRSWQHIQLEVNFETDETSFTVDGRPAQPGPSSGALDMRNPFVTAMLGVLVGTAASGGVTVYFDNYFVDLIN